MDFIKFLRAILRLLVLIILFVIDRPIRLIWMIYEKLREICQARRRGGRTVPCLPTSKEIHRKPDPLIYSQSYLMNLGMAVTWDNPDIVLSKGGVPADSHNLEADANYDLAITVHNGSNEAPAIGLKVHAYFRNWGTGGPNITIGHRTIDLPVRGSPNEPAIVNMPWHTPATPGHYCIMVELDHVDDLNPANNIGQENTNIRQVSSNPGAEVSMAIPIWHQLPGERTLRIETTGYKLPDQPLYPPLPKDLAARFERANARLRKEKQLNLESIIKLGQMRGQVPLHNWTAYRIIQPSRPGYPTFAEQYGKGWLPNIIETNSPANHPTPTTWLPELSNTEVTLSPEEETTIEFKVQVPEDAPPGTKQRFQVNAFDDQTGLVGGVELIVKVT